MATIRTSVEGARGCGFRKQGGLYLVSDAKPMLACGKLPLPIPGCADCAARGIRCGINPTRGFTWLDADALFAKVECRHYRNPHDLSCLACPLGASERGQKIGEAGLLWVGEKFYGKPQDFLQEALAMGVSRRISKIPKKLKVGETWVLFAHRKALANPTEEGKYIPAIFSMHKPERIEYVVRDDDTEEKLDKLEARGLSLVRVVEDKLPLFTASDLASEAVQ